MSSSIDAIVHSVFATSKNFGVSAIQLAAAAIGDAVQIGAFAAHPEYPLPFEQKYDEQLNKFYALTTQVGQTYMAKRGFGYHPCLDGYFVGSKAVRSIYFCTHEKTYSEQSVAGLWGEVPLDVLKIATLNVRASVIAGVPARMEMEGVKPSLPYILKDMATKAMREVAYERGPVRGAVILPMIAAYAATTQPVTDMNVTDAVERHLKSRPSVLLRLQNAAYHC